MTSKRPRTPATSNTKGVTATFQAFEASFGIPSISKSSAAARGTKHGKNAVDTPSKLPGRSGKVASIGESSFNGPAISKGKKRAISPETTERQTPRPAKRPLQSSFADGPLASTNVSTSRSKGKQREALEPHEDGSEDEAPDLDREQRPEELQDAGTGQPSSHEEDVSTLAGAPATTSLSRLMHSFRIPAPKAGQGASSTAASTIDAGPSRASKPLNALGSAKQAVKVEVEDGPDYSTSHRGETTADQRRDSKPTWAVLQKQQREAEEQDVLELLSPRKKRRGWVPAGLAERAAQLIKRAQTSHTLWQHELSRLLQPPSSTSEKARASLAPPLIRDLARLTLDANPGLRLQILQVHSQKPASLALAGTEGGFITGGAAEKLLLCTCRILEDETPNPSQQSQSQGDIPNFGRTTSTVEGEDDAHTQKKEGLVLFSLACHPKSASATPLARPGQKVKTGQQQSDEDVTAAGKLSFAPKNRTLSVPGNVADLHSLLGEGEEIWAWDPWAVVDAGESSSAPTAVTGEMGEVEIGSKALLVSRFAVLQ